MILVVTGSRDASESQTEKLLHDYIGTHGQVRSVFVGDCPTGVDSVVRRLIEKPVVFLADWDRLGRAAGPARNSAMLQHAYDANVHVIVLAILAAGATNRGTRDCVNKAIAWQMEVDVRWVGRARQRTTALPEGQP